ATHSLVDYNRGGVPLVEIVSLPDLRSATDARASPDELGGVLAATAPSSEAPPPLRDYNRAGVPLVEIVSLPDLRSATDARAYVDELRGVLVATGASDGKMEEGSLRGD